jgi:hypothetical protein
VKEACIFLLRLQLAVNEITGPVQKTCVVVLPPDNNNTGRPNYGNQKNKTASCPRQKNWTRERIELRLRGRITQPSAPKRVAVVIQKKTGRCVQCAHPGHSVLVSSAHILDTACLCPVRTSWTQSACVQCAHPGHSVLMSSEHILDKMRAAAWSTRLGFTSRRGHQLQCTGWCLSYPQCPDCTRNETNTNSANKPNLLFANQASIRYFKFVATDCPYISRHVPSARTYCTQLRVCLLLRCLTTCTVTTAFISTFQCSTYCTRGRG